MALEAKHIQDIYASKVAMKYDTSMAHFFPKYKKFAFEASSLKKGDRVLVFCCGSGLDFPYILEKIGKEGQIVAVDFSSEMLQLACEKVLHNQWENIQLIEADITKFEGQLDQKFDAGVCTLGLSIIPEYKLAFHNLCSNVKQGGEVIIGDMQLASGWLSFFNLLILMVSKKYGGTYEGHHNSLEICLMMREELADVKKKEFFLQSYFYSIGTVQ